MDSVTHILGALLWTEPIPAPAGQSKSFARWRDRACVILGALLPDADGILGLLDTGGAAPSALYAKYHRVLTHSVIGFLAIAAVSALIARYWPERWLLPSLRRKNQPIANATDQPSLGFIAQPSLQRLFSIALIAVFIHFILDAITSWGTLRIFWPFSTFDAQLNRVNSLDPWLLIITAAAWMIQRDFLSRASREGQRPQWQRRAWVVSFAWLILGALYVWLRPIIGPRPFI
ncbi:MAG: metal-dependent hydrolase [Candidatus Sumerlaeota bacterium]|nr:metal-dependent hydrolase [Candidatus Sumerlaeota bacterium]